MTNTLLTVTGLKTQISSGSSTLQVVDDISFSVNAGETFVLLGESGCGKSMTALSIMRLLPEPAGKICGGEIHFAGQELLSLPEVAMRNIRGRKIAMIFQEPMTSLNPVLTVQQQVGEVLERHLKLKGKAQRERIIELLDSVGIPDPAQRIRAYPHQLSGGMKQRVMIAIALACEPQLLIADEPTTALDVTIQAQILALLAKLQKEKGMGILMITHDLGVVAQVADRVAVMYGGQIVEQSPRAEFFQRPQHPYSRKLFESLPSEHKRGQALSVIPGTVPSLAAQFTGCRFEPRCDVRWSRCAAEIPAWWAQDSQIGVRCHLADPAADAPSAAQTQATAIPDGAQAAVADGELLQVQDVKVHFPIQRGVLRRVVGQVKAVDGVSLSIAPARTLALVGESGCGKTTVGKAILQLIRPTSGSVKFAGQELTQIGGKALRALRAKFQIIFQDPFSSMNPRMMVGDIVEEGMRAQNIGGNKARRREYVDKLLAQVGLDANMRNRYPHEFSGGQRQRICIARALAVQPDLIVCDEPTSALDVSVQAQVLNLLKELQRELGLSYLFITHNLAVVSYLAHEVAVMYLGRIVEFGSVVDVLESPRHPYTQALLSAVPTIDQQSKREVVRLEGDMPSPIDPPSGCHFHPRCPHVMDQCREQYPASVKLSGIHFAHCHLLKD